MLRAILQLIPRMLGATRFESDVDPLLSDGGTTLLD
jgi:hypothetical protein